jgi:uroporphyrin-3 C-methyltransferase
MQTMTQNDATSSTVESSSGTGDAQESPVDSPQGKDAEGSPPSPGKNQSGSWISYLSLLVALVAAAGAGYQWNEQRSGDDRSEEMRADLGAANAALMRLTSDSQKVEAQLQALTEKFNARLDDLPGRVEHLERTLDTLPGIATNARSNWLLAEVEYLLRVANVQLNLAGNVDISLRALDFADEKLRALGDPGLTRVRSALDDERAALRAVPRPDAEGIVISLSRLSRSIDGLPLGQHAPDRFGGANDVETTESGWQRAWRVIVDALFSIISVKRDEATVTPVMSDAGKSMLIRSLDLELQTAKLAILRNESNLYQDSLQAVAERLENYFDTDVQAVIDAQNTVNELLATDLPQSLPDISGSLALLLQFQPAGTS